MIYCAIIAAIIAILAVAGGVRDAIDLNHAIKARDDRDRAWRAYEMRVIAEHERHETELEVRRHDETENHQ
ncbi:hypothetical protein [Bifidobacterium pseudolongum]|jgi:hypothetical protein|uniref:hypothetical protein n=1 Tax=Bifidobacterium pseudolongum TaxID=1694 RepID=UPI00101F5189|nr:hypothetical protein [Bifidobacterium pseudolongum]MCH4856697.1 hypothetical protein [Bifidobacterium pseudolongum]RYQ70714.1 hypothetical protein PG2023B_1005 [Bifidobacterium pseudolongum subsp. globosum]